MHTLCTWTHETIARKCCSFKPGPAAGWKTSKIDWDHWLFNLAPFTTCLPCDSSPQHSAKPTTAGRSVLQLERIATKVPPLKGQPAAGW